MNCCDRILLVFLVFSFFQYQLRWSRDDAVVKQPWSAFLKAQSADVPWRASTRLNWTLVNWSGIQRLNTSAEKVVLDDHDGAMLDASIELSAPPFSYHTVSINDRKVSLVTSPSGSAHITMTFGLPSDLHVLGGIHRFDDLGDVDGVASVYVMVRI